MNFFRSEIALQYPSRIVEKLLQYVIRHGKCCEDGAPDLENFDREYVDVDHEVLLELIVVNPPLVPQFEFLRINVQLGRPVIMDTMRQ